MRALNNAHKGRRTETNHTQNLAKKLIQLQNANKDREALIFKYEEEIKELEHHNHELDQQLHSHQQEWQELEVKLDEDKDGSEDEQEMDDWINSVQKYNGLPQTAIDSLCSIEFEGDEHEICLSCYSELSAGAMCTYLPCSHLFHHDCIANHLKVNRTCPACQEVVDI